MLSKKETINLISQDAIQSKIFVLRNKKVMLDQDLAMLYEVETKMLKRAVKRNIERFPEDFMFELNENEFKSLRCQIGTSNRGGIRYLPYAFTEHGILMLSSVLNSKRAINVNIQIMRAFIKMREMLVNYQELKQKLKNMERKVDEKSKVNSYLFEELFKEMETVKKLLEPPIKSKTEIGFRDRK